MEIDVCARAAVGLAAVGAGGRLSAAGQGPPVHNAHPVSLRHLHRHLVIFLLAYALV